MTDAKTSIDTALFPYRLAAGVGRWRKKDIELDSAKENIRHTLNESAAAIFHICDGLYSVDKLIDLLEESYPVLPAGLLATDVKQCLADLADRSLIAFSETRVESAPILRIQFLDFGPGFDPNDNYFTRMMAAWAWVFITRGRESDVLFHLVHASGAGFVVPERILLKVDALTTRDCLHVFVSDGKSVPDFRNCDYAFSPHQVDREFGSLHCQIPYKEYAESKGDGIDSEASRRFYEFLFPAEVNAK